MFKDRQDAGRKLARMLEENGVKADLVLAIPRGALPLGRIVADSLGIPLDVVVAKKMGAPSNPELAIGAVASDGSVFLNEDVIRRQGIDESYVEETREQEAKNAGKKLEKYRGNREPPELEGKTVVLVDDGVATGATMTACIRQVKAGGAERIVLAVPVGPPGTLKQLENEVDEVFYLKAPRGFMAVGQFYRRFHQVTDEEAVQYLESDG